MLFHPAFHAERDRCYNTISACLEVFPDLISKLPDDQFRLVCDTLHVMAEATGDLIDHDTQQIRILDALNTALTRKLAASDNDPDTLNENNRIHPQGSDQQ